VVLFIATATMNFGMACEMSGKSIACAIADDDAAVRPRSFRPDGAASPGMLIAEEERGRRRGMRPCCSTASGSRQYATRSIGIASRIVA
jgi:hypothetical protein